MQRIQALGRAYRTQARGQGRARTPEILANPPHMNSNADGTGLEPFVTVFGTDSQKVLSVQVALHINNT